MCVSFTAAVRRGYLHGVRRNMHVDVSPSISARMTERNPLLVAGKLDEFTQLLLRGRKAESNVAMKPFARFSVLSPL